MDIQLELNGVKITRKIPIGWAGPDAVTFGQFLDLESMQQDKVKVLAYFLGMDDATLRRAKITGLEAVLLALGFLGTQPELIIPEKIMGYAVPKDLAMESIGQYADLRDDLKLTQDLTGIDRLKRYPLYCATYACRPYDWKKAEAMQAEFMNAPAAEVLAIGHFTLLKLIGLSAPTKPTSPTLRTRLKKAKRAFRVWLRNTGFMVRYYIWRGKQAIAGKT